MESLQPLKQSEILLVDDSPEHIEVAISVLCDHNFKIRVATSGSAAYKLIEQHQPDLILLDVYMPEVNGFEVCHSIKNSSKYSNIPIIFLTASNDEESIQKGFEVGAQDYVTKPFHIAELLARVNTHIKLKQQTESLTQANKELDSFCYSVSHDLKAPLLSIGKLTEYLALDYSSALDSEGQQLIHTIQEKSLEVIHIIDRLLEFSRMCEMQIQLEDIHLEELFLTVYHELMKLQPERQVSFQLGHLPTISGDPLMIKLLVLNIISNALKYTSNKEHAVITISSCEQKNDYIISIKDNGAGFDMRYAGRLFEVFERLHSQREFEGSGVGLAISQKILKRHHGKAWMTGAVDEGATFYFSFPK